MDTDAASITWFLVPAVLAPLGFWVRAWRAPSRLRLARWAAGAGVVLTATNVDPVRNRLGRARRIRSTMALPLWWLASIRIIRPDFPAAWASPMPALVAYLAGAILAELTAPDLVGTDQPIRQASLLPRRLEDYAPAWIRVLPWLLIALAGLLLALAPLLPHPLEDPIRTVAVIAGAVLVAGAAEVTGRRIVGRPQRSSDPDLLAADDGLRATGVAVTTGASVLAATLALSGAIVTAMPDQMGWFALVPVAALGTLQATSVGVWWTIVQQETWGHRLRHRQQDPAVAPC